MTSGSANIEGEGLKVNMWSGSMHNIKGNQFITHVTATKCLKDFVQEYIKKKKELF